MSRMLVGGLSAFFLMTTGAAGLAAPMALTDRQLDAVIAGASSGTELLIGGTAAAATAWTIDGRDTASGSFAADKIADPVLFGIISEGSSMVVTGQRRGKTVRTPLSSVTVAVYTTKSATTGDGTVTNVEANGRATGDRTFTAGHKVSLGAGRFVFLTVGIGIDRPS